MALLQARGVPAGMVQNARDRLEDDPQLRERGFYPELEHPVLGRRRFEGMPARLSDTPAELRRAAPILGMHNGFVLQDVLGLGEEEVLCLRDEAAI
jgi:crotonobetainyl-CoA:carnitine CoA-transferase CaiB-like acyl-CoA transferase